LNASLNSSLASEYCQHRQRLLDVLPHAWLSFAKQPIAVVAVRSLSVDIDAHATAIAR
jgi:hypothetical protein